MAFGIIPTGFATKTLETLLLEIQDAERAEISTSINTASDSVIGQLNGIFAAKLAELWELAAAVYEAQHIDGASDYSLRALAALTGTTPIGATRSTATLTVSLGAGFTLPAGSIVAVNGNTSARFETLSAVTNGGGSPASFSVNARAISYGPITANAGTLAVIVSPTSSPSGWITSTNTLDASKGAFAEADASLRQRQQEEVFAQGSSNTDAIRLSVLDVSGVIECSVIENTTALPDANGLAAHSIQVTVFDGTTPLAVNTDVAQAIFDKKPAGIGTNGSVIANATDSEGVLRAQRFNRATILNMYLSIDIVIDATTFGSTGSDDIENALVDFGDANYGVGDDVVLSKLYDVVFNIPGVIDITGVRVGIAPTPTQTTNYVVGTSQIADLDTSRITINVVT